MSRCHTAGSTFGGQRLVGDAGVGQHEVQPAVAFDRAVDELAHRERIAHVHFNADSGTARLFDRAHRRREARSWQRRPG